MGGDKHYVSSFYAEDGVAPEKSNHCPELPAHLTPMNFGKSIWLGSSQRQIKDWLGELFITTKITNGWSFYDYSGPSVLRGFDEFVEIGIRVIDGRVVSLFATKTTSN